MYHIHTYLVPHLLVRIVMPINSEGKYVHKCVYPEGRAFDVDAGIAASQAERARVRRLKGLKSITLVKAFSTPTGRNDIE